MNVLIILAHPELNSFNGQPVSVVRDYLVARGHQIQVSNLFQEGFKSHADQKDFPMYSEVFLPFNWPSNRRN